MAPSLTRPRSASAQRRGEARRQLLLETTLELVGREGVDAVHHRRVAQLAGVPLGSTTYWFTSREDMLVQALAWFAEHELELTRDRLGTLADARHHPRRLVDRFAELMMRQLGPDRIRARAQYALLQEAAHRPELQPVVRSWTAGWHDLLELLFTGLGRADPRLDAQLFLALLDGLMLTQLAAPDDDFEQTVLRPALRRALEPSA
ncbi:MAG TPA: TetR family transcriptional regulator C-terminal domain-containing protein [Conexibacter sp.]|nr:TetR family transcriptional regulator C-terminal domain-containing protein [Conexibacter sp.]